MHKEIVFKLSLSPWSVGIHIDTGKMKSELCEEVVLFLILP